MSKLRRFISGLLAFVLLITVMPQSNVTKVNAAQIKAVASLPTLGYTKTPTKIGSKEHDVKWFQNIINIISDLKRAGLIYKKVEMDFWLK